MSLYPLLLLPVVAAVLGALVLLLRRGAAARLTVPSWLAYGIAGTILAVGLVYALVLGFTPPWPPAPTNVVTPPEFMMPGGFRPPPGSYQCRLTNPVHAALWQFADCFVGGSGRRGTPRVPAREQSADLSSGTLAALLPTPSNFSPKRAMS